MKKKKKFDEFRTPNDRIIHIRFKIQRVRRTFSLSLQHTLATYTVNLWVFCATQRNWVVVVVAEEGSGGGGGFL